MTNQTRNEVLLEGIPVGAPEPSHENHGQLFYRQILEVPRLSGTADRLPLLVRQTQLPLLKEGVPLRVEGQLRSFNNRSGPGRRLVLTVYARSLQPGLGEPVNRILLAGTLCKPPIYRRTPLGRSISDLILAVPRSYGRADYLPVIAWGQVASQVCTLEAGAPLSLEGRIQSRVYRKVTETGPRSGQLTRYPSCGCCPRRTNHKKQTPLHAEAASVFRCFLSRWCSCRNSPECRRWGYPCRRSRRSGRTGNRSDPSGGGG